MFDKQWTYKMLYQVLYICFMLECIKYGLAVVNRKTSGPCESCVELEECPYVQSMDTEVQKIWVKRYPCDKPVIGTTKIYEGFSPIAKGDHICCPQGSQNNIQNGRGLLKNPQKRKTENSSSKNGQIDHLNNPHNILNVRKNQERSIRPNIQIGNRKIRQVKPFDSNPFFIKKSLNPKQVAQNPSNNDNMLLERRCEVRASLPPAPEAGCCGQDASDADRITGGNETELDQFPWTVLLRVLFNYGDRKMVYSCGGSLISPRYVLTAAHCVNEEGAQLTGLEITLAEYDKRTFPNDCVAVNGEGRECIQNIVIPAEDVIIHPLYEDAWLHNDIALIRLGGFAPYTRFIRTICLAPLDIDIPNLNNLPLSVAGWGRNQQFSTNVKQSTILNLVPHEQCTRYYPNLSNAHICAAGSSGEDTCKGDSGGPLMILFRGRYYVMGVVSGKRADSPCGTNVPSLFTNVFHYIDWIQSVIGSY